MTEHDGAAEPNGCRWCGRPQRTHASRYTEGVGYHTWAAPTDEQRKTRMLARRAARRLGAGQRPVVAGHDTARVAPPAQIDALARVLMSAWEKAEHKPVTASYIATFADMARAALAAGYHQTPANQEDRDAFCHALSYPIADTMEAIGIEDVDLSDGRMLADAIYCLGYRIPAQEDTSV